MKMHPRAKALIKALHLSAHPEGGYYKETHRSLHTVRSPQHKKLRNAVTDIYFLLVGNDPSRFHKVVHDEIWHYYEGDPLMIVEIMPKTFKMKKMILGLKGKDICYKHCVKGGTWQAAYSTGDYSLVGCTVAPGFDFSDFKFLKDDEKARVLCSKKHPGLGYLI